LKLNLNKIIILTGPTASGKTEISIKIAQLIPDIEIISADSMQIYKYLNIGTDKPPQDILKKYKHHGIDLIEPSESYDVKQYTDQAHKYILDIISRKKKPIIVGGSGLYIKSLIEPLFYGPGRNQNIRDQLVKIAQEKGNLFLYEKLKEHDFEYAQKINVNDTKRIIRALEVFFTTGKPISFYHKRKNDNHSEKNYHFCIICISMDRRKLYKRIDDRVSKMIEKGLIEETRAIMEKYQNYNLNALQGLSYKHIVSYLEGRITKDEAIEKMKKDTRNFAKRQLSWFKNQLKIDYWLNIDQYINIDKCLEGIVKIMREEGY